MNTHFLCRFGTVALIGTAFASAAMAAPAAKTKLQPAQKAKAQVGIKQTPQMAGAVGRFGEIYGLKSGWTFEILGARYSYDAFDDYGQAYPATDQKFLLLQIAIKNNTPDDNYFNTSDHQFQIQDADNQLYTGGAYRLSSMGAKEFGPTLKPGQGAGQDPNNRRGVWCYTWQHTPENRLAR